MSRFADLPDLAAARLGGRAIAANDEFFAHKENLLKASSPVFIEHKYTGRGKWMDGWETRRKRTPGHDWCVVQLGMRGVIRGVNVNTAYFTGNYPEQCSIEACDAPVKTSAKKLADGTVRWTEILAKSPLKGGSENLFEIASAQPWTHVRLNIYPDGGVARLRIHGEVIFDWSRLARSKSLVDLAALEHGGVAVSASDMFFGSRNNLLLPGRAKNMGDGWETKRRRGPGYDWVVVRLGHAGVIRKIELDTNHFKGNYPDSCTIQACNAPDGEAQNWREILPKTKLKANFRHFFQKELRGIGPATHVRLNIHPDGGVSRLRVYGQLAGN